MDLYQSLNVRTLPQKPASRRNLSRRLPKPALGNGRVQIQCKRAFIAFDGPISSSDAIDWAFPKADRRPNTLNRSVRRALESIGAVRVGRSKTGRGTPIMWRLADDQSSDLHACGRKYRPGVVILTRNPQRQR